LSNVSASFAGDYARTSFHAGHNVLYADLSIRNTGQYPIDTPLLVGIAHLSEPTIRVRDADGVTPDGIPYYDFSKLVTGGTLNPGQATASRAVAFYNPNRVRFTYDLVPLGRLNQPPAFTTTPVLQVQAGRHYAYAAAAVDPNGD